MSWAGAYDMAGNVKEWCLNEADSGKRYIMGGAWNEPTYMFNDPDARSPFDRSANFGFRCAKYALTGEQPRLPNLSRLKRGISARKSPFTIKSSRSIKASTPTIKRRCMQSLNRQNRQRTGPGRRSRSTPPMATSAWSRISSCRRKAAPPFQTVVYFPGAGLVRSIQRDLQHGTLRFRYQERTGRDVSYVQGNLRAGGWSTSGCTPHTPMPTATT